MERSISFIYIYSYVEKFYVWFSALNEHILYIPFHGETIVWIV